MPHATYRPLPAQGPPALPIPALEAPPAATALTESFFPLGTLGLSPDEWLPVTSPLCPFRSRVIPYKFTPQTHSRKKWPPYKMQQPRRFIKKSDRAAVPPKWYEKDCVGNLTHFLPLASGNRRNFNFFTEFQPKPLILGRKSPSRTLPQSRKLLLMTENTAALSTY